METKMYLTLLLNSLLVLVLCHVPMTFALNRNLLNNVPLISGTSTEGGTTHMENQIVGTIPLIPTLKLGLMSVISTLFLPGLHFTLTMITIVFALVGVASFLCSSYDCRNILRGDDYSQGFKSRHPMYHKNFSGVKPWEAVPVPGIFHSLDNTYTKYNKDSRVE